MKSGNLFNALLILLAVTGLASCGGGGGGYGIDGPVNPGPIGSGSTVVGTIGGFGSIIMSNGDEYDTNNVSTCDVDDQSAPGTCEDSLSVGMHISIKVDANGAATSVHYDDDLEGPATNITGSDGNFAFTVFGADVVTTNPGTQWRDFDTDPPLTTELDGANVEISGEWRDGTLHAMYIEKQDDATHEVKGTVGTVSGFTFPLTLEDGTIIEVDATNANLVPVEGDYVEVEGTFDGVTFFATEIELEDEGDFDDDGEAEITGTLTETATGHAIGSTAVDISNAPSCTDLVGSVVEAEGHFDLASDVLIVEECEKEDDELEMECMAGTVTVDAASPKVGSVECTFPGTTGGPLLIEFRDVPDLAVFSGDDWNDAFDLTHVNAGDCVEIEASRDSAGAIVAGLLELEEIGAGCESYELGGPVDAITDLDITVLGVTYVLDDTTDYSDGIPAVGDIVEVEDSNGDGVADSVETDD